MPMVWAREVLDEKPRNRSSTDEGREAPAVVAPLWADVPADILGSVLRLLACAADRASVRSVCCHWRTVARAQALPAPLPVLVLPRFIRFSCLTSDGALTAARRAHMLVVEAGDHVRVVGSCDDWLIGVKDQTGECFLVNAFSSEMVHLPCLRSNSEYNYICLEEFARLFRGLYQSGACLFRSALSASPSSGSKYIVAALTYRSGGTDPTHPGLAIWQHGMTSWHIFLSTEINSLDGELVFYKGKLYMVQTYTTYIFAFELREDEHGVSLSCPEKISPLIPSKTTGYSRRCNLVVWRQKLLLVIRFFSSHMFHNMERNLRSVEVFALDFSTSPCGVTQIYNFDGDCIFVQKSGCRSFSTGSHDGIQGDLIYFSDALIVNHVPCTNVHNMRDGTLRRIDAGLRLPNSGVQEESFHDFPVWIFPSS